MSMMEWAKREVEIASKRERGDKPESEWDYGCACYDSALKAFESLCGDGHSGFSIGITKGILNRLIEGKPLTPIEDTEDVWNVCSRGENGGVVTYQCKRMSSLFNDVYPDGTVKYHDNDRYYCIKWDDPNLCWHNGFIGKIYSEMFPLTMPYMPSNKSDVIVCDELLTDRKNGDFDTVKECKYEVPSVTSIGMLYQELVLSTMKEEDASQGIIDVFSSFITDEISDFNSSVYYTNPDYLRCSYLSGEMLA